MSFRKLLLIVGGNFLLSAVLLNTIGTYLFQHGKLPEYARGTVVRCIADLFRKHWSDDSWGPMITAVRNFQNSPTTPIYQSTFFELPHWLRFQYPLPTLLPLWLLARLGAPEPSVHFALETLSWLAVMATAACAIAIALRSATGSTSPPSSDSRPVIVSLALLASLSFYPVMWAYDLGQLQVFGNLLFCLAFYCWLTGRERTAGLLIGMLVLMKPQFFIVLAWGALRRRWPFVATGAAVVGAGFAGSILVFGLANHVFYIQVLSFLAKHGEGFYANQSFNGLLNRLTLNWPSVTLMKDSYPPYRPVIYLATTITSAMLVLWALAPQRWLSNRSRMMDFSAIAIVATAASPIAWYHHYGILLPILIWLFIQLATRGPGIRHEGFIVIIAYLLVANDPRILNLAGDHQIVNLVQSLFFLGVLILIVYLKFGIGRERDGSVRAAAAAS